MASRRGIEPYRVFLSYSHKDRWIASQIVNLILGERGVVVFQDEKDIEGGEQFPDKIRNAIQQCDEFLVLLTPNSRGREWVHLEIGGAWVLRKLLAPILSNLRPQDMPEVLQHRQAIDLNHFEDYLGQLRERIEEKRRWTI